MNICMTTILQLVLMNNKFDYNSLHQCSILVNHNVLTFLHRKSIEVSFKQKRNNKNLSFSNYPHNEELDDKTARIPSYHPPDDPSFAHPSSMNDVSRRSQENTFQQQTSTVCAAFHHKPLFFFLNFYK